VNYLVSVLQGKQDQRIQHFNHDRLSVFGIGDDVDLNQWRTIFRQLIASGYLNVDLQGHGSLRLSRTSRPILRGETTLRLRIEYKADRKKRKSHKAFTHVREPDQHLWEQLRLLRKHIAEKQGVPAYVVFHDATLMEMLEQKPENLTQMRQISGVGETKLEHYGRQFIDLINSQRNHQDEQDKQETAPVLYTPGE
jgi:ATP-dependent DNA helicase RecQ